MSYTAFVKLIKQLQSGSQANTPVVFELTADDIADLISLIAGRKDSVKLKTKDGRTIEVRYPKG